jgi:hypothetical protein
MRGFHSAEELLRTLLLHIARGYSLRETTVQAAAARLSQVSDVALMKRLRSSELWLRTLCLRLLEENGMAVPNPPAGHRVRIVDGTIVREPGKTGSQWRILYAIQLPELLCDFFQLTPTEGEGNGESLSRVPVSPKDLLLGDAIYSSVTSIESVVRRGADVLVRINSQNFVAQNERGNRFNLLHWVREIKEAGQISERAVSVPGEAGPMSGRVCAVRKSEAAIREAHRRLHRKESKKQVQIKAETWEYAKYVMVFTTWDDASTAEVLEWYRVRWQVELAFKRLKSLAQLGHLPKHDERSSRAWLYGKLFVALLTQKLIRVGRDISPWGYRLAEGNSPQ